MCGYFAAQGYSACVGNGAAKIGGRGGSSGRGMEIKDFFLFSSFFQSDSLGKVNIICKWLFSFFILRAEVGAADGECKK